MSEARERTRAPHRGSGPFFLSRRDSQQVSLRPARRLTVVASTVVSIGQPCPPARPGIYLHGRPGGCDEPTNLPSCPSDRFASGSGTRAPRRLRGDCDSFPGGVCPPFSNPRQPPDFGDGWWNIKSAFTDDLVVDAPASGATATLGPNGNGESQQFRFRPKGAAGTRSSCAARDCAWKAATTGRTEGRSFTRIHARRRPALSSGRSNPTRRASSGSGGQRARSDASTHTTRL